MAYGDIFRIERHTVKIAFDPVETKVVYRIICGSDVKIRPREVDGSDTIATGNAEVGSSNDQVPTDKSGSNLNSTIVSDVDLIDAPGVADADRTIDADDADAETDLENDEMELAQ